MVSNMEFYYGIFRDTPDGWISVQIPDVKGCWTQGKTLDEALEMAIDALAGCLAVRSDRPAKSSFEEILKTHEGRIMAVPVDEKAVKAYDKPERINVMIPGSLLREIDEYRGKQKMKRSELFAMAAKEYMASH